MPYSISTLLIRNLQDVFGESDPPRRRAVIDEIFTQDCVFYDSMGGHWRKKILAQRHDLVSPLLVFGAAHRLPFNNWSDTGWISSSIDDHRFSDRVRDA